MLVSLFNSFVTLEIEPNVRSPSMSTLLLNVVALATVPPVKVVPAPTADPFQVNVPLSPLALHHQDISRQHLLRH